jgi:hypothetical protein
MAPYVRKELQKLLDWIWHALKMLICDVFVIPRKSDDVIGSRAGKGSKTKTTGTQVHYLLSIALGGLCRFSTEKRRALSGSMVLNLEKNTMAPCDRNDQLHRREILR